MRKTENTVYRNMESTLRNHLIEQAGHIADPTDADDIRRSQDSIGRTSLELGLVHLAGDSPEFRQALTEIWTGLHSRSNLEKLGTLARVANSLFGHVNDKQTYEYLYELESRSTNAPK